VLLFRIQFLTTSFGSSGFLEKYATQANELNQKLESVKEKVKKLYER
jgi:hypothetical protein